MRNPNLFSSARSFSTPALLLVTAALAAVFWFSTGSSGFAGTNVCTVCHKNTQTILLACNSLDYQRHLDHGDPSMACSSTRVAREGKVDESRQR